MSGINIYLSSFTDDALVTYKTLHPESEMNILLSYGTRKNDYKNMVITNRSMINSLICDSGAFTKNSAKTQTDSTISLDGYIAFAGYPDVSNSFDFFFNYDEDFNIDGFETNYRNMKQIEANGIQVVPVVHDYLGDEIDCYLEEKYPIIALGYSEHKKKNKRENIKYAVNKIVSGGAKVHLLGISSYYILNDIPVHYCDSSSWAQESKFGNIIWWNPHRKRTNKTDRVRMLDKHDSERRYKKHIGNYKYRDELEQYIHDTLKMNLKDLEGDDEDYNNLKDLEGHNKDFNRQLLNIHFFVQLQDRIRKVHKERGFVINEDDNKTKILPAFKPLKLLNNGKLPWYN